MKKMLNKILMFLLFILFHIGGYHTFTVPATGFYTIELCGGLSFGHQGDGCARITHIL